MGETIRMKMSDGAEIAVYHAEAEGARRGGLVIALIVVLIFALVLGVLATPADARVQDLGHLAALGARRHGAQQQARGAVLPRLLLAHLLLVLALALGVAHEVFPSSGATGPNE